MPSSPTAVTPSTATRMCDRLAAKDLVRRERDGADRREVTVALSPAGTELVRDVTRRRRAELRDLLGAVPADRRGDVVDALRAAADAAGELPDTEWAVAPVEL